ncbi:hypothetical protein MMC13_000061 [Lambiella insularis]|nr:hypothetical protein [Lambiella insularis]
MPPKKAVAAASQKKATAAPAHASYKDMIKEAILNVSIHEVAQYLTIWVFHACSSLPLTPEGAFNPRNASPFSCLNLTDVISYLQLKDRTGSSRQALKKYILANNKTSAASPAVFDTQFNKALRTGVEKGDFQQPKGPSGPVKLAKKEASVKAETTTTAASTEKPATKKSTTKAPKTEQKAKAPKKTATKAKAAPAAKKAAAPKKAAAAKPKANTATKRKAPATAPAIVPPQDKVQFKTKSGRITKTAAPAKKAAAKKATTKKAATPKKKAAAEA